MTTSFATALGAERRELSGEARRLGPLVVGGGLRVEAREALERLIGEHQRLTGDWSFALWTLLMFETWCARYEIGPDALP